MPPAGRAVADLFAPAMRGVMLRSLAIALAVFAALWIGGAFFLAEVSLFRWRVLDWLLDLVGVLAALGLSWLLFPAVATMVIGFFLDRVAGDIETRNYPGRGPPRLTSIGETVRATLRLMGLTILLNILALPVYLLMPGANFFVFLGLNGYLLGREYFEVVALRRLDPAAARAMRRNFAGPVFAGGIVIAGAFAVPVVNLVAPIFATALMVHLFEGLRRAEPRVPAV